MTRRAADYFCNPLMSSRNSSDYCGGKYSTVRNWIRDVRQTELGAHGSTPIAPSHRTQYAERKRSPRGLRVPIVFRSLRRGQTASRKAIWRCGIMWFAEDSVLQVGRNVGDGHAKTSA